MSKREVVGLRLRLGAAQDRSRCWNPQPRAFDQGAALALAVTGDRTRRFLNLLITSLLARIRSESGRYDIDVIRGDAGPQRGVELIGRGPGDHAAGQDVDWSAAAALRVEPGQDLDIEAERLELADRRHHDLRIEEDD